jgi:hypothetical protein
MKDFAEAGINRYRVRTGPMGSDDTHGNQGMFVYPIRPKVSAVIIADEGLSTGWEHVSVHVRQMNKRGRLIERTPTWDEMCAIKDLFWDAEDTVVQYHPPKSEYVNNHSHVLHLWRSETVEIPRPPAELVGMV